MRPQGSPSRDREKGGEGRLSTVYYRKAKLSAGDRDRMKEYMETAMEKGITAIKNFDSWTAYYNMACDLSVLNRLIEMEGPLVIISGKGDFSAMGAKEEIFEFLRKAFAQKPALVVHSRTDSDLQWLKERHADEFYALVGRVYDANHGIL